MLGTFLRNYRQMFRIKPFKGQNLDDASKTYTEDEGKFKVNYQVTPL